MTTAAAGTTTALPGVPLIDAHLDFLVAQGISASYLELPHVQERVRSVTSYDTLPDEYRWMVDRDVPTGILFGWDADDAIGRRVWQFRPDAPTTMSDGNTAPKYAFPKGAAASSFVASESSDGSILLIVEGTKQSLAVAAALHDDPAITVVGIPGCRGWSRGGVLAPIFPRLMRNRKKTYIIFDADAATNLNVYRAGTEFKKALGGGVRIRFVQTPGLGDQGIDDVLADFAEDARGEFVTDLLNTALPNPALHCPPPQPSDEEGEEGETDGLIDPINGKVRPLAIANAAQDRAELVLDPQAGDILRYDEKLGIYTRGVAGAGDSSLDNLVVTDLLLELVGNHYHSGQETTVLKTIQRELARKHRAIPGHTSGEPLVHFRNGWVDLREPKRLLPHSPDRINRFTINVDYDPAAQCPTIDEFLHEATLLPDGEDQARWLWDGISQLLDWTRRPTKIVYLVGETRAGKGTLQALVRELIPANMVSAVTLHALESDQFASAHLHGSLLNVVGETDVGALRNPAIAKMATGDDPILGNRKYGKQFEFHNMALFLLAGNDIPTVHDPSGSFLGRLVPTIWPHSNLGKEDHTLLPRLRLELPGLVNRLIEAWQARQERGGNFLTPHQGALDFYRKEMNPAYRFSTSVLEIAPESAFPTRNSVVPEWSATAKEVFAAYKEWAGDRGYTITKNRDSLMKQLAGLGIRGAREDEDLRETDARRRVLGCRVLAVDSKVGKPGGGTYITLPDDLPKPPRPTTPGAVRHAPLVWTFNPIPDDGRQISVLADGVGEVSVTTMYHEAFDGNAPTQQRYAYAEAISADGLDIAKLLGGGTPVPELAAMPTAHRAALAYAVTGLVPAPAVGQHPAELECSAEPFETDIHGIKERVWVAVDRANLRVIYHHQPLSGVPGAVEYRTTTAMPRDWTDEELDALEDEAQEPTEPPTEPPTDGNEEVGETATDDPVFGRLTPAFWELVVTRGVQLPAPATVTEAEIQAAIAEAGDPNPFAAGAIRSRLLAPATEFKVAVAGQPAVVTMSELAGALDLPPLHARGYVRASQQKLAAAGVLMLERRLGAPDTLGQDIAYLGGFVEADDKRKLAAAVTAARKGLRGKPTAVKAAEKAVRTAQRALAAAEKRKDPNLGGLRQSVADAQTRVDQARAEQARAEQTLAEAQGTKHNTEYLPLDRMGYAVVITSGETS